MDKLISLSGIRRQQTGRTIKTFARIDADGKFSYINSDYK